MAGEGQREGGVEWCGIEDLEVRIGGHENRERERARK